MKINLSNIILAILLLSQTPITTLAEDVEIDGIMYSLIKKIKEATVISKDSKYSGDIIIPSTIEYEDVEYCVTSIGESAFIGCTGMTSIKIPKSVTSIGYSAFSGCSSLISITIPNSVTNIDNSAFRGCSELTSITIPNSVTNMGKYVFEDCSKLTKIVILDIAAWCKIDFLDCPIKDSYNLYLNDELITDLILPDSVYSIGDSSFSGCTSLISIDIPNSVTSIGEHAFFDCTNLSSVTIEYGLKSIKNAAFYGCSGLTSITIPNSVTSIGSSVFNGCSNLTSITIPNSVTNIGQYSFNGCSGLSSVTIPNSVHRINYGVFQDCSNLNSITIPNSVTSIGGNAFFGCSDLTSVTIGNGVQSIESIAFKDCKNLETVSILTFNVPNTASDAFDNSYIDYATLYVPDESIDAYKSAEPWSNFGTIKGINGTVVEKEKCATPTIHYADGKLTFECETEGATCYPTVTKPEVVNISNNEIELSTTYKVSVYAAKPGYEDSDVATAEINMAQGSSGRKGDMDNDGEINITDALIIINIILGRYY